MPRINLSQAEADQIQAQRELIRAHAITYNQGLEDAISAIHDFLKVFPEQTYDNDIDAAIRKLRRPE